MMYTLSVFLIPVILWYGNCRLEGQAEVAFHEIVVPAIAVYFVYWAFG